MKEINELKVRKPQAYFGIDEPLIRKQLVICNWLQREVKKWKKNY